MKKKYLENLNLTSSVMFFRNSFSFLKNGKKKVHEIRWKKNKGNENKIIFEGFHCTMDKMDRDGQNKTKSFYWCRPSYALSKLVVDNGLQDRWSRESSP